MEQFVPTPVRPSRSATIALAAASLACLGLAAAGALRAFEDGIQDASSMEQVCRYACDASQAQQLADRLANSGAQQGRDALALSRLALINDPASPLRWCDLGDLLLTLGDGSFEQARTCYRRAEELAPANPYVLIRVANFHFQAGEPEEALQRTERVLKSVRAFDEIVFSSYARFGVPQAMVLQQGVPPDREPARAYLRFVLARGDLNATKGAWQRASSIRPSPLTDTLATSYVNLLWKQREYIAAAQTWASYMGSRAGDYLHPNRLFNGGFESELAENALDWQHDPVNGVEVSRDTRAHQQGQASLRIAFLGTQNLNFHELGQTQPVPPGAYRFRAMVRNENLTTDQGIHLRIFDPEAPPRLDVSSPMIIGSSDWREVELRIEVRAPTRLVRVEVTRQPSLKFDNKIAGTVWLDEVSLVPAN